MSDADLFDTARAWLAAEPDDDLRVELSSLFEAADSGDRRASDDLAARFDGRLQFGTAGLRAAVAATKGPSLIEIRTDRTRNVEVHERLRDAAREALGK